MGEARPKKNCALFFRLPPFVLTRDGCKDISLTPSKKVPLDRPVPLLFLAYPESSLLRTCMPAYLTAVAFRTQRLATYARFSCLRAQVGVSCRPHSAATEPCAMLARLTAAPSWHRPVPTGPLSTLEAASDKAWRSWTTGDTHGNNVG